ncbi:MAG: hypothetical protein RLZZ292_836 [Bacteroidota bacterium]
MTTKTILILGAKSDIAEAVAYRFAQEGYTILLAARQAVPYLSPLAADLQLKYNIVALSIEFDGTNFDEHAAFYSNLKSKPNIVISCFGYLGEQKKAETNIEETLNIINTNYLGHISILNSVANDFERRKEGTIIGISSVAGERGRQSNYLYGSAKAGFTAYLGGLRNRLYPNNVHVMTVKPGFVRTKMTEGLPLPKSLTASPQQVANDIYNGYKKQKNTIYVLPIWRYILLIIRNIPEFIFKRLHL